MYSLIPGVNYKEAIEKLKQQYETQCPLVYARQRASQSSESIRLKSLNEKKSTLSRLLKEYGNLCNIHLLDIPEDVQNAKTKLSSEIRTLKDDIKRLEIPTVSPDYSFEREKYDLEHMQKCIKIMQIIIDQQEIGEISEQDSICIDCFRICNSCNCSVPEGPSMN